MLTPLEVGPSEQKYVVSIGETQTATQQSVSGVTIDPKEVAEYSASILANVRDIAAEAGLTFLAYLIQVAVEEAKIQSNSDH